MTTALALLIQQVAQSYDLPSDLLAAQVQVESGGDPFAFRNEPAFFERYIRRNPAAKGLRYGPIAACSCGLLQVMVEVAYEHGFTGRPEDLFADARGLVAGAIVMQGLLAWATGNYVQALCAYNGGKDGNETAPFRNIEYAQKVFAAAGKAMP